MKSDKQKALDELWVGKWVRFMQSGKFVLGQVGYVKQTTIGWMLYTDCGAIDPEHVLETR